MTYAEMLDLPFVFSSNGDGFVFHDRTGQSVPVETNLTLDQFPSPQNFGEVSSMEEITDEIENVVKHHITLMVLVKNLDTTKGLQFKRLLKPSLEVTKEHC